MSRTNPFSHPSIAGPGSRLRAVLTLLAALAFVVFTYLGPQFSGYDTTQMPRAEPEPAVQPAGYAFGIWIVIYAWLVLSAAFGLVARADAADWDAQRWPLILAMGLGAGWTWVAVRDPVWATVMIFAMLAFAVLAVARAPRRDVWLALAPNGLFAGWLTAASFVSLGLVLAGFGILESSHQAAYLVIPLAAIFAVLVMHLFRPGAAYPVAVGWGLAGVAVANLGGNAAVVALALAGVAVLALVWLFQRDR